MNTIVMGCSFFLGIVASYLIHAQLSQYSLRGRCHHEKKKNGPLLPWFRLQGGYSSVPIFGCMFGMLADPHGRCFYRQGRFYSEWLVILVSLFWAGCYPRLPLLAVGGGLLFSWLLIMLTLIDIRAFLLPDIFTQPLLWGGLCHQAWVGNTQLDVILLGVAATYFIFYSLKTVFYHIRGVEGMGGGDVKLAAALAAWLGPATMPYACFLASLLCGLGFAGYLLFTHTLPKRLPFGPFLALSGWLCYAGAIAG